MRVGVKMETQQLYRGKPSEGMDLLNIHVNLCIGLLREDQLNVYHITTRPKGNTCENNITRYSNLNEFLNLNRFLDQISTSFFKDKPHNVSGTATAPFRKFIPMFLGKVSNLINKA